MLKWIVLSVGLGLVLLHQFTGHNIHRKFGAQLGMCEWPTPTRHEWHGLAQEHYKDWGTVVWFALMIGIIAYFFSQSS